MSDTVPTTTPLASLRVCPDCGLTCALPPPLAGFDMQCPRCGKNFQRAHHHPLTWSLACAETCLLFFSVLLSAPFLEVLLYNRQRWSGMTTGPQTLAAEGFELLAIIIFLTSILIPLMKVFGLLTVLGNLHLQRPSRWIVPLFRHLKLLNSWSMAEIYLLGFLVAYTRLQQLVHVHIELAAFALVGLVLSMVSIDATLEPEAIWDEMKKKGLIDVPEHHTAHTALIGCPVCHQANPAEQHSCVRCGAGIGPRKANSIVHTWALIISALFLYFPANAYPILEMTKLGQIKTFTILGGAKDFIDAGIWPLALLVFVASIVIPLFKLMALAYMLWATRAKSQSWLLHRTRLYRFIDFIGRWSMIDIFMLSILVGLVRFGSIAQITSGTGAICFASVVILTMLAVMSFDPRLMWEAAPSTDYNNESAR